MTSNVPHTTKQKKVVEAAFGCFSAYGFKRTNMADIAKVAGMSRPALYLLFAGKQDIGRAVVILMNETSLNKAKMELEKSTPFSERLAGAMHARVTAYMEAVEGSPHGQELFDTSLDLAADILTEGEAAFQRILQRALRKALKQGEIHLDAGGLTIPRLADVLIRGVHGQKVDAGSAKIVRRRIDDFLKLVLMGL